jgi:hypothetical protein
MDSQSLKIHPYVRYRQGRDERNPVVCLTATHFVNKVGLPIVTEKIVSACTGN